MADADPVPRFDLDALVAPLRADEFLAQHWERQPLHRRRGDASYYRDILVTADLEQLISSSELRFPAIQLARDGGYLPPELYTKSVKHGAEVWTGVPDVDWIRSAYAAGATVVLPALHRTWPALRALCTGLERRLSHAVHANAYLTAASTTGFMPHYDTHDVFVLQIGGKKRWRVHAPPVELPHRTQPFVRAGLVGLDATPATSEVGVFDLDAGDLLYLPRGYVHSAATSDVYSAHVTIGVTVYTWVELLSELAQSSRELVSFREALPVGFANREGLGGALRDGFVERLGELLSGVDYDDVVARLAHRVRLSQSADISFRADVSVADAARMPRST